MFQPEFCCCAIPLVNIGIYTLLTEQLVLGLLAGVLCIATPTIVGTSVPTFTPFILAVLCFILAGIQCLGFFGVFKEKTRLFRTYSLLNAFSLLSIFAASGALIAVSGVNHTKAVTSCEDAYFSGNTTTTAGTTAISTSGATAGEGKALCEAFAWADLGIMGGLWLLLVVVQGYMVFMTRAYSNEQKEDHKRYKSIYSVAGEEFMMGDRATKLYGHDDWDANADPHADSDDPYYHNLPGGQHAPRGHNSQPSYASEDDYRHSRAMSEGGPSGSGSGSQGGGYGYGGSQQQQQQQQQYYSQQQQRQQQPTFLDQQDSGNTQFVDPPEYAHQGRDPGQTPTMGYSDYVPNQDQSGGLRRPEEGKRHPAEGMFGRKSPRIMSGNEFDVQR